MSEQGSEPYEVWMRYKKLQLDAFNVLFKGTKWRLWNVNEIPRNAACRSQHITEKEKVITLRKLNETIILRKQILRILGLDRASIYRHLHFIKVLEKTVENLRSSGIKVPQVQFHESGSAISAAGQLARGPSVTSGDEADTEQVLPDVPPESLPVEKTSTLDELEIQLLLDLTSSIMKEIFGLWRRVTDHSLHISTAAIGTRTSLCKQHDADSSKASNYVYKNLSSNLASTQLLEPQWFSSLRSLAKGNKLLGDFDHAGDVLQDFLHQRRSRDAQYLYEYADFLAGTQRGLIKAIA